MYSPKTFDYRKGIPLYGSQKLTERKIRYIIRAEKNGQSYKQITTDLKLSISTIKGVWIYWLNTDEMLPLKKGGRKRKVSIPMKKIIA
jgi:transposase